MRPASTIASAFDPRRNSLNAIRLLLAVLVIVSHTWPVGGYGQDPGSGPNENLGAWAVAGFFAISGYLITGSRLASLSLRDYLWRRLLRIYPAFLVVLLVVAFGFAPLSLLLDPSAGWSPAAALRFVVRDLGLYMFEYGVGDTLQHVPTPAVWNASLWTLSYEFACYLMIGVLVTVVRRPGVLLRVCAALLVLGTAAMLARQVLGVEDDSQAVRIVRLSTYFLAGAVLFLLKERVPSSAALAAVAAATVAVLAGTGWFEVLAALPVAYLMLWLGARLPLARIGARHDVS